MIDIAPKYLLIIKRILKKYVSGYEVRSFGSRITGKAKTYSDLDLVIMSEKIIDKKILYALEEEFAESDLPFRVDILDWQAIPDSFQKIINEKSEII
ncbi:putative protein adenylyltransferase MntA [Gammaproteobacteria bacterium]